MTTPKTPSSRVDMRGFAYPLAPYMQKLEWQMQSLQAQMARAQQAVALAQQGLQDDQAKFQLHAAHLVQAQQKGFDAVSHRRGLVFLASLQHSIEAQKKKLSTLTDELSQLRDQCVAQQRKIEGLAEHRVDAEQDYAVEIAQREASEADRNWIARASFTQKRKAPVQAVRS